MMVRASVAASSSLCAAYGEPEMTRHESAATIQQPAVGIDPLRLNVIHVFEKKALLESRRLNGSFSPISPIDTDSAIAFAVDCYRARWTIEEFFKALKAGCQFEWRQLESAHSLLNALAILVPVAWRLLLLRTSRG